MIRPRAFGFNSQTASSNAFQSNPGTDSDVSATALHEFDAMVDMLRSNDIDVVVVEDTDHPKKPDAVFPNNWVSFHEDGSVVLYPMLAENRRAERNIPVLAELEKKFTIKHTIDLSVFEKEGKFLEGTGSIVFDYVNRIAYASRSPRTHEDVLTNLCEKLSFRSIVFNAVDEAGQDIYHTNVLMSIGTKFVVICLDAIRQDDDQEKVLESFSQTGHKVIAISYEQMRLFGGNMIEVMSR